LVQRKSKRTCPLNLDVRPLTPDLWPALENLFGPRGACNGCWCMYWRIGAEYRKRDRHENKEAFRAIVNAGPPPGLIAFAGDLPVGWCQITPRDAVPHLEKIRSLRRVDELPVWSISCFYIRIGYRKRGVTTALIESAVEAARAAGAPAIEAYPLDAALTPSSSWTGFASNFLRAGFQEVARYEPPRPILRKMLG
jgi:GNAT superfamily N-acetyltransferase